MRQYATEELVLGDILHEKAESHGSRTFLKLRDGEQSYAEVNEVANRMARGFVEQGVRQRDHVAVMMGNCAEFLHVIFALAKIGAVAVPINIAYKGDILQHVLDNSDTTMLVVDASCLDQVAPVEGKLAGLRAVVVRNNGSSSEPTVRGLSKPVLWLRDLLGYGNEAPSVRVRHSDLQAIMFTSGTTGLSKGVMTTHALALIDAEDSIRYLAYQPGETVYCPIPLFHAAALWDGAMVALLLGSPLAIVERFSASRFWEDVRRFGANVAMGIFSMIPILLKQPPTPDDRNHPLRAFYVGKSA
ncbi:MAG: AMP-binding protein, partial [Nitrospinales bacterium]